MIDYGKQKSTVRPEELELTETKVFVSSNITDMNLTLSSMTRTNTLKFRQRRMLILKMKLHRRRLLCVKSMK